jgi:hypothetical protein
MSVSGWVDRWPVDPGTLARVSSSRRCQRMDSTELAQLVGVAVDRRMVHGAGAGL